MYAIDKSNFKPGKCQPWLAKPGLQNDLTNFTLKQVDVFPYLKTRRLCVLLHYLNYHWYNSTVKINRLIK